MTSRTAIGVIAALQLGGAPAVAQNATGWTAIDRSMSSLLTEGYAIQSMSAVQTFVSSGVGGQPDVFEYNFVLVRQGRWVVCIVSNPQSGNAFSRCRALN